MTIPKQAYTTEFKQLAVKRVKDGQTAGAVAQALRLIEQTLRNWVKASARVGWDERERIPTSHWRIFGVRKLTPTYAVRGLTLASRFCDRCSGYHAPASSCTAGAVRRHSHARAWERALTHAAGHDPGGSS